MFGEVIKILAPQPVRIPDLDAVAVSLRQPLAEHLKQFKEMVEAGHLQFVEVLELEHQWADMLAQRFDGLKESLHQTSGEKVRIGHQSGSFLLAVMMGQGDAVRHLDAEEKARRHRFGVFANDVSPRQNRHVGLEQGPEPLVDFDGGVMPAVLLKEVATPSARIDQSLPGFVFPTAGADAYQIRTVHAMDYN